MARKRNSPLHRWAVIVLRTGIVSPGPRVCVASSHHTRSVAETAAHRHTAGNVVRSRRLPADATIGRFFMVDPKRLWPGERPAGAEHVALMTAHHANVRATIDAKYLSSAARKMRSLKLAIAAQLEPAKHRA